MYLQRLKVIVTSVPGRNVSDYGTHGVRNRTLVVIKKGIPLVKGMPVNAIYVESFSPSAQIFTPVIRIPFTLFDSA